VLNANVKFSKPYNYESIDKSILTILLATDLRLVTVVRSHVKLYGGIGPSRVIDQSSEVQVLYKRIVSLNLMYKY
jgi:hypothetical protein